MATKKDQLQSYQFSIQRMVSALVTRETDPETAPFKRVTLAAFWSLGLMVLALAVVWVYGMVVPGGNKAWSTGESVIVEKETGTRFVYVDGHLHPVTNYVSALLTLGKKGETKRISQRSLTGVPRGPRIGIEDAPDALPPANQVLTGGWTLCSQPALDQSGARSSESVLMVGQEASGGTPMSGNAMLVEVLETGDQYLISKGYRHKILKSDTVAVGLALQSEPWARVGQAFIAALPDGEPIAPYKPAGIGKPSTAVPDRPTTRIGQLFVVHTSGGAQYFLATQKKLVPISDLQYDIQRAYRPMAAAYGGKAPTAIELGLLSVERPADGADSAVQGRAPSVRPSFVAPHDGVGTVCATFAAGRPVPTVTIDPVMPPRDAMSMTTKRGKLGTALADRIVVSPGTAAVVMALQSDQAPIGTIFVVTDLGRAYALADPKVLDALGFEGVTPIRIPAALIARVPQGPSLDPKAALRAVG